MFLTHTDTKNKITKVKIVKITEVKIVKITEVKIPMQ